MPAAGCRALRQAGGLCGGIAARDGSEALAHKVRGYVALAKAVRLACALPSMSNGRSDGPRVRWIGAPAGLDPGEVVRPGR